MQFNVKHYIAIGLGIGLATAYCLHLGFNQKEMDSAVRLGNLRTLSNLEKTEQIPKPDFVESSLVAKLKNDSISVSSANQTRLENDFAPPESTDDFDDQLALSPIMLNNVESLQLNSEAKSSSDSLQTDEGAPAQTINKTADVDPEILPTRTVENKPRHEQKYVASQLVWKKNPYFGDGTNVLATFNSPQSVRSLPDQPDQPDQPSPHLSSPDESSIQIEAIDLAGPSDESAVLPQDPITVLETQPAPAPPQDFVVRQDEQLPAVSPAHGVLTSTAAQQAVQHIEYGKSLARRGAAFAARQEFFLALNIIAQSKDESSGSHEFGRALTSGFLALKETEGFVMDNIEAGTSLDVASVIESHRSNVLTRDEAKRLTPVQAMQLYFEFAQKQLEHACGRNVVSAEAFFCLGKLYSAMSNTQSVPSNLDASKSIVFHKASLQCDETSYRSANELGVLMVQTGQLEAATEYFKQSLILNRTPQAWMNLAKTHRRLGENDFAELAEAEFVLAAQAPLENSNLATASIQWMPTNKFNSLAPPHNRQQLASQPANSPKTESAQNKIKSLTKSFSERLKDLF